MGCVILVIIFLIFRKSISINYYFTFFTFLIFILIGIAAITFKKDLLKKNHYTHFLSDNYRSIIEIDDILKPNSYYENYNAKVIQLNSKKVFGKIKVNVYKDSIKERFKVGDQIVLIQKFDAIQPPLNPYQFNYKNYLKNKQIYHQVSIKNNEYLYLNNNRKSFKRWAYTLREQVNKALIENGFKGEELAIINALLLGQRQDISEEVMQNFQKAGAVHILAVSGLHIGIIMLLLNFLLKPLEILKKGSEIKLVLVVLFLWFFAFVAGLSPSVVRAVTMFTAVAIALTSKNTINTYNSLIISIFILLLINPYYLFEVGFQLSYLAVFFIVWLQPMLYKLWKPKLKLADYSWQLLTVSTAAQLGVLPLSLYYFHQFPGLFFMSNLIIIPFLGMILGFGILIILLASLKILPAFLALFYEKIIFLLNQTVGWIAQQESFFFQNISFSIISLIFTYLFIVSFFKWFEIKKPNYLIITLFALILLQTNFLIEIYKSSAINEFIILNKSRQSVLIQRTGQKVSIDHTLENLDLYEDSSIKSYLIGSNTDILFAENKLKNVYALGKKKLMVVDSLAVYLLKKNKPDIILLTTSPKINLERLITEVDPKLVIADASNYKSYVSLWQKTCKNNNIKFHYTVKDGAFIE
ncbi:MAG: ComEC family competence protein [Flavobacteriaceae bacterium]|nr:ComEC family competence protein [Flavobacteriaceae bacterium]